MNWKQLRLRLPADSVSAPLRGASFWRAGGHGGAVGVGDCELAVAAELNVAPSAVDCDRA